jgi:transcriptional regulator with XRE-family HTH domain
MKFPPDDEAIQYQNLRLSTGMTATEIAKNLGVTRETISRREAGTAKISREAWLAMAYVAEEMQQVIWSYKASSHREAQHDEAQHDEAQHDEAKDDESRTDQTSAEHAQTKAPKKRKVKRWK